MAELWCIRPGLVPYEAAKDAQHLIEEARHAGEVPDVLLMLEHPPVYTRGRRSEAEELPMGEDWYRQRGIEVCDTDRGGRVTYHGPGQLVGYPIIGLRAYDGGVHGYVRRLERVMTGALADFGVEAQIVAGLTGVWTAGAPPITAGEIGPQGSPVGAPPTPAGVGGARKLGAIGIHVRREITTHGFAINVSNDLTPFEWIVPCGIDACQTTSVARELGAEVAVSAFTDTVVGHYEREFDRVVTGTELSALSERVDGLHALLGARESLTTGAR